MKINWGTSIVIAFGCFMAFILFFVFKVQGNPKYDNELVVEEYYKQDAKFGDVMLELQNANNLNEKPVINYTQNGVDISFPASFIPRKITGKVSLYRPSAKKLDFEIPLSLSGPSLLIPKSDLAGGQWDLTLSWQYEGQHFMMKKNLYIE